jgi:predicted nuclease with TOPRIM domain
MYNLGVPQRSPLILFKMNDIELAVKLSKIDDKLEAILQQVTKTNGRVTDLENRVDVIEKEHIANPIKVYKEDLENLKKDIEVIRVFSSKPKILMLTIAGILFLLLASGIFDFIKLLAR